MISDIRPKARPIKNDCTACITPKSPEKTQIPWARMVQVVYNGKTNIIFLHIFTVVAQVGAISVPLASELRATTERLTIRRPS